MNDNAEAKLRSAIIKCIGANASAKSKLQKLAVIIDGVDREAFRLNKANCKRGCDSCCHYYVGISVVEAEIIADFIGVKNKTGVKNRKYLAEPKACPFLKNRECSIYSVRPLACRTYYVMGVAGRDVTCCDLSVDEYCSEPLKQVHFGVPLIAAELSKIKQFQLYANSFADIRDFFPGINN